MWTAVITIAAIALVAGIGLSFAARRLPTSDGDLVEQINDLLPQTQCAQCGYPGCRPFAAAVVDGNAAINLCPPGGEETMRRLADLLGREALPLQEVITPAVEADISFECDTTISVSKLRAMAVLMVPDVVVSGGAIVGFL